MKKIFPLVIAVITVLTTLQVNATVNTNGDPIKIIRADEQLMLYCNTKITFDLSSSGLNDSAIYELSVMASKLIGNPNLKIEIAVHNDTRSDIDYSKKITTERANKIKEFLVNYGIPTENLIAIGYGDTQIMNRCRPLVKCSSAEHNANKRVEFKILNPEELNTYTFVFPKIMEN